MRNQKKQVVFLFIIITISFVNVILYSSNKIEWKYDIYVGIFTSSIVACFITLIQYNYEKNRVMENIRNELSSLMLKIARIENYSQLHNIEEDFPLFEMLFNLGSTIIESSKDVDFISPFRNKVFYKQFSEELFLFQLNILTKYNLHFLMIKKLKKSKELDRKSILCEYERLNLISKSTNNTIEFLNLIDYDKLTINQKQEYHYNEIIKVLKDDHSNEKVTLEAILNKMNIVIILFPTKFYVTKKDINKQIETNSRIGGKWDSMSTSISKMVFKNINDYLNESNDDRPKDNY
jgi:hypothetical protein